jgi:hypothetical protein
MKYLLGLFLLLGSFGVKAEMVDLPTCNVNNVPVDYQKHKSINKYDPFIAMAIIYHNGYAVIQYSEENLKDRSEEWQTQVLLHECGHLQDLSTGRDFSYYGTEKEYAADCYSVMRLKIEYGYGKEEFEIIAHEMLQELPIDRVVQFKQCVRHY